MPTVSIAKTFSLGILKLLSFIYSNNRKVDVLERSVSVGDFEHSAPLVVVQGSGGQLSQFRHLERDFSRFRQQMPGVVSGPGVHPFWGAFIPACPRTMRPPLHPEGCSEYPPRSFSPSGQDGSGSPLRQC